ncbi:hypothetical protein REPUB_Repub18cG0023400 [Reevesia pubescens]
MAGKKDLFMELLECHHYIIISLLPFKQAAKTSILSKRWLKLWHATRNIEFNESFFVNPEEFDDTIAMKRRVFIDFVKQWFDNSSELGIDKFALVFSKPGQFVSVMENFIALAIAKKISKGLVLILLIQNGWKTILETLNHCLICLHMFMNME